MKTNFSNDAVELVAGPLVMTFHPVTAMLRYIRLGDIEIVRGIFAAIRDQDWDTIPFSVSDLKIHRDLDHFQLCFWAKCAEANINFDWRGEITGSPSGEVRFAFHGQAQSTFLRNRIGLCVLHPIRECAGRACTIEHNDSSITASVFPKWIAPHQPFQRIRSITHRVTDELDCRLTFDGEVFETEDQRNWTDASYKTYCTPLELPFPVEVEAGSRIDQSVSLRLVGEISAIPGSRPFHHETQAEVEVNVDWSVCHPLPSIGLSMATCTQDPTTAAVQRLHQLRLAHLRVDVGLGRDGWIDELRRAMDLASQLETQLEVATFCDEVDGSAWKSCLRELNRTPRRLARWLVYSSSFKSTPDNLSRAAWQSLREQFPGLPIAVGSNAYFAELNRQRPTVPQGCAVCYSINPQVHAFDNLSICETLEAQRWTVDSAHAHFGTDVVISPITLRPRFNPNATSARESEAISEPGTDERQSLGFAAAWTVGVLSQLATHQHVASLTLYETIGPRGIMTVSGEDYPVASVFDALRAVARTFLAQCNSPREIVAMGIRMSSDESVGLLLGNLTKQPKTVCVLNREGERLRCSVDGESIRLVSLEQ